MAIPGSSDLLDDILGTSTEEASTEEASTSTEEASTSTEEASTFPFPGGNTSDNEDTSTTENELTDEMTAALEKLLTQLAKLNGMTVEEYVKTLIDDAKLDYDRKIQEIKDQLYLITELDDNGLVSIAEDVKNLKALIKTLSGDVGAVEGLLEKINEVRDYTDSKIQEVNDNIDAKYIEVNAKFGTISQRIDELSTGGTEPSEETEARLTDLENRADATEEKVELLEEELHSSVDSIKVTFENVSLARVINAMREELSLRDYSENEIDGIVL